MKFRGNLTKTAILGLALLAGVSAMAMIFQLPIEDSQPSALNRSGRQNPRVNSERRVRTQVVASQAANHMLDIGGIKYSLLKREDGAWNCESRSWGGWRNMSCDLFRAMALAALRADGKRISSNGDRSGTIDQFIAYFEGGPARRRRV